MRNVVLVGRDKSRPSLDEVISLLSPVDIALASALELIDALREVSYTLFNILWKLLSTLKKSMHSDHVSNCGDSGLSSVSKLLGMLLQDLLVFLCLLVLSRNVKIEIALDLSDFGLNGGL